MAHGGGCLCGGIRYVVQGPLENPVACHCSQCARTSGNFAAMSACRRGDLEFVSTATLTWFRSSDDVQRGFCAKCGGNVFWRVETGDEIYVTAGSLDAPTGLKLAAHIFVGSIADFYEIRDDLPKKDEW